MKSISILFFIIIAVIQKTLSTCQADSQISGLFQDTLSLHINSPHQKQIYSYPTILFQNQNPRLAYTLTKIQIKNLVNIDFQIASIYRRPNFIDFHFISNPSKSRWRQIRLTFWLISQQMTSISIGFVLFENIKSLQSKSLVFNQRMQPLLKKVNQQQSSEPKVFISSILGLSVQSASQNIQIKTQGIITKTISQTSQSPRYSILFSTKTGQNTYIKFIRVCYILYAPSRLSATKYHYSTVSLSINSLQTYSILKQQLSIFPVVHSMIGITGFRLLSTDIFSLSISLQSSYIDFLQFNTLSKIQNIQVNYLVIGVDMMMSCIKCGDSFIQFNKNDRNNIGNANEISCVSRNQCTQNQIQIQDSNGMYYSCRKCLANTIIMVDKDNNKYCGCKPNYIKQQNQICKKIEVFKSIQQCQDPNSIRDSLTGRCVCKQGFLVDDFGFCGGCNSATSYWDLNTQKCTCLPGFKHTQNNISCVQLPKICGARQILQNNICICEQYTIKKEKNLGSSQFQCIQCQSGMYKVQDKNQCSKCPITCHECLSHSICLACNYGYFFSDFKCISRCGDGFKTDLQGCDDGNYDNQDGCNQNCLIQDGYQCKQDLTKKSTCQKKKVNNQVQQIKKQEKNQIKTVQDKIIKDTSTSNNIKIDNTIKTENKKIPQVPNNTVIPTAITQLPRSILTQKSTQPIQATISSPIPQTTSNPTNQNLYKLSISKSSPIHLSSGILLQLLVLPAKNRTQHQLNTMFRIQISDKKSYPPAIYYSQDKKRLSSIRCYLHYNNQLPVVNFSIKVYAMLDQGITRSLTLYFKAIGSALSSVKPMSDVDYLQ